jgi:hypothetical protein
MLPLLPKITSYYENSTQNRKENFKTKWDMFLSP